MKYAVVYNTCHGGFDLSSEDVNWLEDNSTDQELLDYIKELRRIVDRIYVGSALARWIPRHHKDLVRLVENTCHRNGGSYSDLAIEYIEGNKYYIDEYDGCEEVKTPENVEWITIDEEE